MRALSNEMLHANIPLCSIRQKKKKKSFHRIKKKKKEDKLQQELLMLPHCLIRTTTDVMQFNDLFTLQEYFKVSRAGVTFLFFLSISLL